jgi:tagatose 1,6-diphosphate aldolase GatY/KbaY
MLARFSDLLASAGERDSALGAFTAYNLEQALGILRAAEDRDRGVVLLVGAQSFRSPNGRLLLSALVAVARESTAPACVQLDHADDPELISRAFALGVGAVLADGSRLSLDENVELVREAVLSGRASAGEVECELGGIAGDEDVAAAVAAGALTEPDEAARFVEQTGAACLAVSIGNVHGVYREPPDLDWPRLEAIRRQVPVPLSLHGASGLSDEDVRRAISLGVVKVNVNTELRERYLEATAAGLAEARAGARVLELNAAQVEAIAEVVRAKLDAYELLTQ